MVRDDGRLVAFQESRADSPPGTGERLYLLEDRIGWHKPTGVHEDYRGGKWEVVDGVLMGDQDPPGKGGFLVTDGIYRDYVIELFGWIYLSWGKGTVHESPEGLKHFRQGGRAKGRPHRPADPRGRGLERGLPGPFPEHPADRAVTRRRATGRPSGG